MLVLTPSESRWTTSSPAAVGQRLEITARCIGSASASRALVILAGTHGVEAAAGRLVQDAVLDAGLLERIAPRAVTLMVPVLNPVGLSEHRTEASGGVDLNRNFLDFSRPRPPSRYDEVHGAIMNPDPDASAAAIAGLIAGGGFETFVQAAHGGQYSHPDGLTYGGDALLPEARIALQILDGIRSARRLAILDVHSGLGPRGEGMMISPTARVARHVFGEVVELGDPALGYTPPGTLIAAAAAHFPGAETLAAVLEYGTEPASFVSRALIDRHRLRVLGRSSVHDPEDVKQRITASFAPEDPEWKDAVVRRGLQVTEQALDWLMG